MNHRRTYVEGGDLSPQSPPGLLRGPAARELTSSAEPAPEAAETLLAIIAHELRNPVAPVVLGISNLIELTERNGSPTRELLLRRLRMMQLHVQRLQADLDRLLDFSRFRSGRLDFHLEDVDLVEVVTTTLADLRPQLEAARCEVRTLFADRVRGRWDRDRLAQVTWNLVSNAIKYAPGVIDIEVVVDVSTARLVISDHGPGISAEETERIFNKFERVSAERHHTGFGVGLWLARHIVTALGGSIGVQSGIGVGTAFTITLPRNLDG